MRQKANEMLKEEFVSVPVVLSPKKSAKNSPFLDKNAAGESPAPSPVVVPPPHLSFSCCQPHQSSGGENFAVASRVMINGSRAENAVNLPRALFASAKEFYRFFVPPDPFGMRERKMYGGDDDHSLVAAGAILDGW
uniref:Uncharacterized protein n=1 Tax=Globodera rostochiensis TaxID=31243 RepID=A0A914GWM3_GLORO